LFFSSDFRSTGNGTCNIVSGTVVIEKTRHFKTVIIVFGDFAGDSASGFPGTGDQNACPGTGNAVQKMAAGKAAENRHRQGKNKRAAKIFHGKQIFASGKNGKRRKCGISDEDIQCEVFEFPDFSDTDAGIEKVSAVTSGKVVAQQDNCRDNQKINGIFQKLFISRKINRNNSKKQESAYAQYIGCGKKYIAVESVKFHFFNSQTLSLFFPKGRFSAIFRHFFSQNFSPAGATKKSGFSSSLTKLPPLE
jgi:hypothetical protein